MLQTRQVQRSIGKKNILNLFYPTKAPFVNTRDKTEKLDPMEQLCKDVGVH